MPVQAGLRWSFYTKYNVQIFILDGAKVKQDFEGFAHSGLASKAVVRAAEGNQK
jgi:hypothetical protein